MTILGMVAILGAGRLENFDHFGDFYHPKGLLLNFGSTESLVSTKNLIEQSVSLSVCLFVCLFVCLRVTK